MNQFLFLNEIFTDQRLINWALSEIKSLQRAWLSAGAEYLGDSFLSVELLVAFV